LLLHRNNRDGTFDEVSQQQGLKNCLEVPARRPLSGPSSTNGNIDVLLLNVGEDAQPF